MVRQGRFITALALGLCSAAEAVELDGYYKNLVIRSETVIGGDQSYWLDINRLRLGVSENWENIELNLVYDNEIQFGNYLDTAQFRMLAERDDPRYWTLQGNTLDRGDVYGTHELYRGTLKFESQLTDIRIGRQQINWATAAIWNPMDRFNPLNPLQLERDERQGVDAVLVDVNPDDLSRLSAAYAPQHNAADSAAAVRYKSNLGLMDWSVMAGEFADVRKGGLSFAGQIGLFGLRSEFVYSDPDQQKRYVEWVIGADYTTYSGLTLMIEGYFNGDGESNSASYDFNGLVSGQKLGVGRHYLGGRVAKEVSTLISVELYAIRNLDDRSYFLYPSISYAVPVFDDLYLGGGAQLFDGDRGDEYGFFSDLYYAEVKFYF